MMKQLLIAWSAFACVTLPLVAVLWAGKAGYLHFPHAGCP